MTDKFESIAVGDTVYMRTTVPDSLWGRSGRTFWRGYKVERVTPKRFVVNGDVYYKTNGLQHGGYTAVYRHGSRANGGQLVVDETDAYNAHYALIGKINEVRQLADSRNGDPYNAKCWTADEADTVIAILTKNRAKS